MGTVSYLGLEIFGVFMLIFILVLVFTLVKPINVKKNRGNRE